MRAPKPRQLWAAGFSTSPAAAELLSEALEEGSLSLAIMSPPRGKSADVEAIFDTPPDAKALSLRLAIMAAATGVKPPHLRVREIPRLDWLKKVAADFPPLPAGRWIVHGAHHRAAARRHRLIPLQIDATSAFGTGEHPTTRGCLLMLDRVLKNKHPYAGQMLDMGCGSGILALAYLKAARGMAVGVDLDPDSVLIARANTATNGVRPRLRAVLGNGYKTPAVRQGAPYDLIMANIFAGPLCRMAHDLKKHLRPGGTVILSGILTHQANGVIAAHRMQGLRLVRHMKIGEWSVLHLRSPIGI